MKQAYTVRPIGEAKSTRALATDDNWSRERARIVLSSAYSTAALTGIEQFSHLEIVYLLDKVKPSDICRRTRHPRGNVNYAKFGIFAQRAKARPNRIGVTVVSLIRRRGRTLYVAGLDAIDGTPVLDIKPVFREFLPKGKVRQPKWVTELMKKYW